MDERWPMKASSKVSTQVVGTRYGENVLTIGR